MPLQRRDRQRSSPCRIRTAAEAGSLRRHDGRETARRRRIGRSIAPDPTCEETDRKRARREQQRTAETTRARVGGGCWTRRCRNRGCRNCGNQERDRRVVATRRGRLAEPSRQLEPNRVGAELGDAGSEVDANRAFPLVVRERVRVSIGAEEHEIEIAMSSTTEHRKSASADSRQRLVVWLATSRASGSIGNVTSSPRTRTMSPSPSCARATARSDATATRSVAPYATSGCRSTAVAARSNSSCVNGCVATWSATRARH